MSVYVDDWSAGFGRMKMCHMLADTTEELQAMVDKIGVAKKWIQYAGTPREHYDICLSKRKLAVENGAVEVDFRTIGKMLRERAAVARAERPTR